MLNINFAIDLTDNDLIRMVEEVLRNDNETQPSIYHQRASNCSEAKASALNVCGQNHCKCDLKHKNILLIDGEGSLESFEPRKGLFFYHNVKNSPEDFILTQSCSNASIDLLDAFGKGKVPFRNSECPKTTYRCAYKPIELHSFINDKGELDGFEIELFNLIAERLGIDVEYVPSVDGSFGSQNENKSWNGIIGMLERGEADLGVTLLTVSESRLKVVDFSIPAKPPRYALIIAKPDSSDVNSCLYFDAFTWQGWLALALATLFLVGYMSLVITVGNKSSTYCALAMVGSHLLQLGDFEEIRHNSVSLRVAAIASAAFGLFVFCSYSSLITSTMSTMPLLPKLETLKDVYDQGYQIMTWKNSMNFMFFQEAKEGSIKRKVYETFL